MKVQSGEVVQLLHLGGCGIQSADKCSAIIKDFGSMVEGANL